MDDQNRRDRTEFFGADDRTEYLGSDNSTRYIPREEPEAPRRPRQYMPEESAYPQTQYGGYSSYDEPQPWDEPYQPPQPEPQPERGGSTGLVLGILALLLALASIVLFFLWRGAEGRANQPPPAPVTLTETQTVTTTPTGLLDELFRRNPDGQPQVTVPTELPDNLPTAIPTEIPPEFQDQADDIADDLQGFIDRLLGAR